MATRLACGAAAGTTGQTVAYPFDVARRRLQVSGWAGASGLTGTGQAPVVYKGMMDCFVRTVKDEGFFALFKVRPEVVNLVAPRHQAPRPAYGRGGAGPVKQPRPTPGAGQ